MSQHFRLGLNVGLTFLILLFHVNLYIHNRLTLMYIQINYFIHFCVASENSQGVLRCWKYESLKDLCNDKRTQIFAIKIVL